MFSDFCIGLYASKLMDAIPLHYFEGRLVGLFSDLNHTFHLVQIFLVEHLSIKLKLRRLISPGIEYVLSLHIVHICNFVNRMNGHQSHENIELMFHFMHCIFCNEWK
jgi:hypothetical protein